jgi:hypothetical protein
MVISLILVGVCLVASVVANVMLLNAATLQLQKNEIYEEWILEFKEDVLKTYIHIKQIDDRHIFEKDDEVGVTFADLHAVIQKLNERTQEIEPEDQEGE